MEKLPSIARDFHRKSPRVDFVGVIDVLLLKFDEDQSFIAIIITAVKFFCRPYAGNV